MSWNPRPDPRLPRRNRRRCHRDPDHPRARDLGGVRGQARLPAPKRQMVGPLLLRPSRPRRVPDRTGHRRAPHPHIGLGTSPYLYRGDFHHCDSIGTIRVICPGAELDGRRQRGVTHSDAPAIRAARPYSLYGIQTWIALPENRRDMEPTLNITAAACPRSRPTASAPA